jgi:hypothetical protein
MSNPTNKQSCKPIHKPTKQMDLDAELPNNLSSKKTQVAYSESKQDAELPSKTTDSTNNQTCSLCNNKSELESFANQPGIDEVIDHPIAATNSSQNQWQMPTPINLDCSGLWLPSKTEVSATIMVNQNAHLHSTSFQITHLQSATPQSFTSAASPSTICSNLSSRLTGWVQSLAVKIQASSTPKVLHQCHAFALLAFDPESSTTQVSSAKTEFKATSEMQPSADSNKANNASFYNKPSSTFQLIVASVDWISKAI